MVKVPFIGYWGGTRARFASRNSRGGCTSVGVAGFRGGWGFFSDEFC